MHCGTRWENGCAAEAVFVCEVTGRVAGFCSLAITPPEGELTKLFVEPEAIGRGYGARLMRHAIETARSLGLARLAIEADPNAEPFYRALGARVTGRVPSGSIPGRSLALMQLDLAASVR